VSFVRFFAPASEPGAISKYPASTLIKYLQHYISPPRAVEAKTEICFDPPGVSFYSGLAADFI
jgi:hypothetical protein